MSRTEELVSSMKKVLMQKIISDIDCEVTKIIQYRLFNENEALDISMKEMSYIISTLIDIVNEFIDNIFKDLDNATILLSQSENDPYKIILNNEIYHLILEKVQVDIKNVQRLIKIVCVPNISIELFAIEEFKKTNAATISTHQKQVDDVKNQMAIASKVLKISVTTNFNDLDKKKVDLEMQKKMASDTLVSIHKDISIYFISVFDENTQQKSLSLEIKNESEKELRLLINSQLAEINETYDASLVIKNIVDLASKSPLASEWNIAQCTVNFEDRVKDLEVM